MKKLWIALTAALGLSLWPAAYAHADWEDIQDEREDYLEELAEEGYFPATFESTRRVYVQPTRRVYIDNGSTVQIRERPVVRHYYRTYYYD